MNMNRHDYEMVKGILDRAEKLWDCKKSSLMMDLEFINETIPLDFEKLLRSDIPDFSHDIGGFYQNFNRYSREMENLFIPRCAKQGKSIQ